LLENILNYLNIGFTSLVSNGTEQPQSNVVAGSDFVKTAGLK